MTGISNINTKTGKLNDTPGPSSPKSSQRQYDKSFVDTMDKAENENIDLAGMVSIGFLAVGIAAFAWVYAYNDTYYPDAKLATKKILDWLKKTNIVVKGQVAKSKFTSKEIEDTYRRIRAEKDLKWMTKDMLIRLNACLDACYIEALRGTVCNIEDAIRTNLPQSPVWEN